MSDPLASIDDYISRTGTDIEGTDAARLGALLADVSGAVRAYTGQTITLESTTVRRRVKNAEVRLSQRPVVDITSVKDVEGTTLTGWTWDGLDRISFAAVGSRFDLDYSFAFPSVVDITYEHGYETSPDDIVGVVCSIAQRSFGSEPADAGITSEGIAGYSYTRGTITAAGAYGMFDQEKAILDRYRLPGSSARFGLTV